MAGTPGADPFVAQLAGLCRAHPTRAKWVIVSSHAGGHSLGERLALEGTDWANLRFKTPFDLALEVAAPFLVERGIDPLGDKIGPALIMRLLAGLPPGTHGYFKGLGSHPQMGVALWSSIRELRLAGIRAADLCPAAFTTAVKHGEFQALLAAYESWLATERRADPAALFAEAMLHAAHGPIRKTDLRLEQPGTIWPPLVRAFLDALPGDRLVSAVPRIPGLALPRRLREIARDERETTSPLVHLMSPAECPAPPSPIALSLFRAGGAEAEIEEVFRRVLHARDGPLPFDSVEIACASPDYPFLIWQKAQRYGWPVTVGPGVPVSATRPARALHAWCDWIEAGYPASGLRRLFQSGDIRLDIPDGPGPGQAARLLFASDATWGRLTYAESLASLAVSERGRAEHPETPVDNVARCRERAAHATALADWINSLLAPLPDSTAESVPLQPLVSAARAFVTGHAARIGELDEKGARAIDAALDDLRGLGDPPCQPAYALDLIRAAVEGLAVGADRARPGHLHVSLLSRGGVAGRPSTFVVGLEEGRVFPSPIEDPVLLDEERARIHPALATSEDRLGEAVHAVVSRLAVVPRACLSYSCRDLNENRETFPSWLVLHALRLLLPGREVGHEDLARALGDPRSVVPAGPETAIGDAGWWLASLKEAERADEAPVLDAFPSLARGSRAEGQRASEEFTEFDGFVPDAGPQLDPRTSGRPVSPTELERAGGCPFAYFLERALRIEAIEAPEAGDDEWLDAATRGTLLHALYADMMRELRRRDESADPRRHLEWLQARADERLEDLRRRMPPPSPEVFAYERLAIRRDLGMFLEIEANAVTAGTKPIAFEVTFGRDITGEGSAEEPIGQPTPITVPVIGGRFALAGRIDRVDRLPRGGFEVVDYKTGGCYREKYKGTFRQGRQLQLVLYSIAAEHLLRKGKTDPKASVVSGRYLFPTVKGGGDDKRIVRPDAETTATVLKDLFDALGNGAFTVTIDTDDCAFCEFGPVCGGGTAIARARVKLANGSNAALAPFGRLRRHG